MHILPSPPGPPPALGAPGTQIMDMYVDSVVKFDGWKISKPNITDFRKLFRISMAEMAGVPVNDVEILKMNASAILVTSRVSFTSNNKSAGIQVHQGSLNFF